VLELKDDIDDDEVVGATVALKPLLCIVDKGKVAITVAVVIKLSAVVILNDADEQIVTGGANVALSETQRSSI